MNHNFSTIKATKGRGVFFTIRVTIATRGSTKYFLFEEESPTAKLYRHVSGLDSCGAPLDGAKKRKEEAERECTFKSVRD